MRELGECRRSWGDKIELRLKAPSRCRMLYEILLKGEVIGEIELDHIAWRSGEAELKIGISNPARQRQGYGTDAVSTLLEHAFVTMNLGRIYLRVHAANEIAVRCYEKAGFKKKAQAAPLHRGGYGRRDPAHGHLPGSSSCRENLPKLARTAL